jgi:lipopolysaccharide exporter
MMGSLKVVTFKNIGYNAVARLCILMMQAATNVVLARHLESVDYGIIGFALIFINFLSQFNDLGINGAVIKERQFDDAALYTGFTMKSVLSVFAFVFAIVIAPLATLFFDNGAVVRVIQVLSVSFLINGMSFLPTVLLTRELNYKYLSLSQMGSSFVNAAVSIALALWGYGYWSLVAANLLSTAATVGILNLVKPVKIRFTVDRHRVVEYVRFGGSLFLAGLIIFAIFNADNLLIGTVAGASVLGYYAVAFTWGSMVSGMLGSVITGVLFPTFSKIQDDRERIKRAYLRILEVVAFLGILVNLSLFIVSREFLFYMLGRGNEKWMPALTAFRILCVYGIIRVLLEPVGSVIMALGKTGLLLRATTISAILEIALLYPALYFWGIEGVAVVVTLGYAAQYFVYLPALKKEIGLQVTEVYASVKPALIAAVVVVGVDFVLRYGDIYRLTIAAFWLKLAVTSTVFFIVYGILSNWNMVKEARSIVSSLKAL